MDQLQHLNSIIQEDATPLMQPGVISIRPGYKLEDGWPSKTPVIVVTVSRNAKNLTFPHQLSGVPIDVRHATPVEEFRFQQPEKALALAQRKPEFRGDAFQGEIYQVAQGVFVTSSADTLRGRKPEIQYTAPAGVQLQSVVNTFPIICHASPDAGWPTLRDFLALTQTKLTVSLYDFTSKHILDSLIGNLQARQSLELTLDHPAKNPTADQTDPETIDALKSALGDKFGSSWALVQSNPAISAWIFPTAYHIKVAVRDSKAIWLSSGNWNNSNQPDIDPINNPQSSDQTTARKSDRDWHIIVENEDIAGQFEAFMAHDFNVAATEQTQHNAFLMADVEMPEDFRGTATVDFVFHAPLRIDDEEVILTPLLTPDPGVYQAKMLELIQNAQTSLYIQLQYIHPPNGSADADFTALIDAVGSKIQNGVDVRIILSQYQLNSGWLDRLQSAGIDLSNVKIQTGVHNKGFVIDSKLVVISSQNWSGDGVLRNRDAGLVIENQKAAKYYEQVFLHDWTRMATQSVNQ